jgi:hypothetical protein
MSHDPVGDAIRAARYADAIMRRTAGVECHKKAAGGNMQSYWDWYSDQHYQGVHPDSLYDFAHWYPKHIDPTADKQTVYDFAKNDAFAKGIPQRFVKYDGTPVTDHSAWNHDFHNPDPYVEHGEWQDQVGSPDNQKSQGGIGVLGEDGFDNPWEGDHGTYKPLPISQPPGHNGEGFDPDEHQDPFDPRLLGASRTASVYDWKPYTPALVRELQDNNLWGGDGVDQRSWETRSDAGDHYCVRPAGSVVNTLDHDHPQKHTGDPSHWEVEHLPPEYGHDPEGYFGDIHGPTALNRWAHPVEGTHPHGFSSAEEAMDWVHARHPEEGFDPDDTQDPFDPRLIGASRLDPADIYRLAGDGMSWEDTMAHIDSVLAEGETVRPHEVMNEDYLDGPHPGTLPRPGGHDRDEIDYNDENGFDAAGFDPDDNVFSDEDDDWDSLGPEGRHDRAYSRHTSSLDTADIIRLAGDGMSWEDTISHIDQVLTEGEPERSHDWDSDYSVPEPGVEDLKPVALDHSGSGLACDHCQGRAGNAFEVNHISVGDDYKGKFCDGCLRDLVPRWYGHTDSPTH